MPRSDTTWRTSNPGHLMYTATGQCIGDKLSMLRRLGFGQVTAAHLALFHNVERGGTRLTVLAARAGLTKQSMIELVNKGVRLGFVAREAETHDKRAKIVVPTEQGTGLLRALHQAIAAADQRMAEACGTAFVDELRSELGAYGDRPSTHDLGSQTDDAPAARGNLAAGLGRTLALAARRFAAEALAVAHQDGFAEVTEAQLALFRNLDLEGTRLSDLAARARMTKQSMRELTDQADLLGLVSRADDPLDGRAKIIRFTASGHRLLEAMRLGLAEAEQRLEAETAAGFTDRLKTGLQIYIDAAGGAAR